jgi:alkanesulfonate monooxygenase SsuD/methylene tetrahydromethanopterin reductase-like flavin-dependent oxidoreductase (luciferase family)
VTDVSGKSQPQFGVNVGTSTSRGNDPVRLAQLAEGIGFDFVSASDHPYGGSPCFETATLLTWILARTERVGVLSRVLGLPLRNSAMLAKTAESMDRLSAGRLILGLGSGGSEDEFRSIGIPPATPGERLAALEEGVVLMRRLWEGDPVTFHGRHHRLAAARLQPAPERPIPIWLGTFGPRALALTGRLADGWIPSLGYRPASELPQMMQRVRQGAVTAGRDPDALRYALNTELEIGGDTDEGRVAGSPAQIIDQLQGFVRAGFTTFNFILRTADPADGMRRVEAEIVAPLRAQSG